MEQGTNGVSGDSLAKEGFRAGKMHMEASAPFLGSPALPVYPMALPVLEENVLFLLLWWPEKERTGTDFASCMREADSESLSIDSLCPPGLRGTTSQCDCLFLEEKHKPLQLPRTRARNQ